MTTQPPLATGREADVFALDANRVLRRSRDGDTDVTAQAEVMTHVRRYGFPVPEVHVAAGADLVMERVDGPTMLRALATGAADVAEAAGQLADLHTRLHRLPTRLSVDPGDRILHLDLHPDNVILSGRGPVVIDWCNSAEGPADLDIALSALILAEVATDRTAELAALARLMLTHFLAAAAGRPGRMLARAARYRAADPALAGDELGRLDAAVKLVERALPRAG